MKTFTDNAGRSWTVALNVDALKRVRSLCDVDLMQIVSDGGKLLDRLMADPVLDARMRKAIEEEFALRLGDLSPSAPASSA